jgi:hypothetical protein
MIIIPLAADITGPNLLRLLGVDSLRKDADSIATEVELALVRVKA